MSMCISRGMVSYELGVHVKIIQIISVPMDNEEFEVIGLGDDGRLYVCEPIDETKNVMGVDPHKWVLFEIEQPTPREELFVTLRGLAVSIRDAFGDDKYMANILGEDISSTILNVCQK